MKLVKDKKFYTLLLSLALPMALQDLIKFSLNLADNIMVGALSEADLSAAALANQPFFIFTLLCFGLASGGTVLVAQYYGKGDNTSISKVVSITLAISILCSVTVAAIVMVFPAGVMRIFIDDPEIIAKGVEYLRIMGWAYIVYGITNTFFLLMRSVRNVKISLIISGGSFFLNIFLNWLFIFGNLGAPKMGIAGAALGTLLSRIAEFIALMIYLAFFEKTLKIRFSSLVHLDKILLKDFFKFSLPVVINEVLWSLGVSMQSVIFGRLGTEAVAANSIVSSAQQIVCVLLYGISGAAFVIVGNQLGAGERKKTIQTAHTLLVISVCVGVVVAAVLFFAKGFVVSLYNIPEETKELAYAMMNVLCIISIFQAFNLTSIVGILRGGGDTRYAMVLDVLMLWAIAIPLGAAVGFWFHGAIPIVFLALKSDEIIRSFFCFHRIRSRKWLNDVTRT